MIVENLQNSSQNHTKMAKEANAQPPRLGTLVEKIMLNSKLAGTPVRKLDMAKTLSITDRHFSSLIRKDREGLTIPSDIVSVLRRKYHRFLRDDVVIKVDSEELQSWLVLQTIRMGSRMAAVMTWLEVNLSAEDWASMQEAIEQDDERTLDEVRARGFVS